MTDIFETLQVDEFLDTSSIQQLKTAATTIEGALTLVLSAIAGIADVLTKIDDRLDMPSSTTVPVTVPVLVGAGFEDLCTALWALSVVSEQSAINTPLGGGSSSPSALALVAKIVGQLVNGSQHEIPLSAFAFLGEALEGVETVSGLGDEFVCPECATQGAKGTHQCAGDSGSVPESGLSVQGASAGCSVKVKGLKYRFLLSTLDAYAAMFDANEPTETVLVDMVADLLHIFASQSVESSQATLEGQLSAADAQIVVERALNTAFRHFVDEYENETL